MKVAIIGLGTMGRAAASNIIAAGHDVYAYDPAPNAAEAAAALGMQHCKTVQDAAAADVILLFLPGPDQIREVVTTGIIGAAAQGTIVVDHSTADPTTARAMAQALTDAGLGWLDAPVLGRPTAVGKWALPVGATPGALDSVRPVLEAYASSIFDVGPPGSGHTIKLLNQMMFGAINAMTAEMMAVSDRVGVAPGRLYEIITASQAGTVSNLFKELGARVAENRYDEPTFSVQLLEKDIRLGLDMARAVGLEPRLGSVVAAFNEEAIADGLGPQDSSVMWTARK